MELKDFSKQSGSLMASGNSSKSKYLFIPSMLSGNLIRISKKAENLLRKAYLNIGRIDGFVHSSLYSEQIMDFLLLQEAYYSAKIDNQDINEYIIPYIQTGYRPKDKTVLNELTLVENIYKLLKSNQTFDSKVEFSDNILKSQYSIIFPENDNNYKKSRPYRIFDTQLPSQYTPPPTVKIPSLMRNLFAYINDEKNENDPIIKALVAHYQFEAIQPFLKGCGYIGRNLIYLIIEKEIALSVPWINMSEAISTTKNEYIDSLNKVVQRAEWNDWIEYGLGALVNQLETTYKRLLQIEILKSSWLEIMSGVSESKTIQCFIKSCWGKQYHTINSYANTFGVTRITARSHIKLMEKKGILAEMPCKKGTESIFRLCGVNYPPLK